MILEYAKCMLRSQGCLMHFTHFLKNPILLWFCISGLIFHFKHQTDVPVMLKPLEIE